MVIVGLLIIPFAFWGINYYFDGGGVVIAAKVNGVDISFRKYQQTRQNLRQQWQAALGGSIPTAQESLLTQQTLDSLVARELLKQSNASAGLRLSDAQVRASIKGLEPFQGENGFNTDIYERTIGQLGLSSKGFEAQMRQDMASEQLQSALIESVFVTRKEAERLALLKNQTRNIHYTLLSSDELKESVEISDKDVEQYYQQQTQEYLEPEKIKIAYIDLSLEQIASQVSFSEDELRAYYDSNRENYDVEGQRKVKQLFVQAGEKSTDEQVKQAKEKAQKLLEIIKSGTSFEDIAELHSDDPGPGIEVTEHGFMTEGIMEPEVDQVMFSMGEGDVSEPIITKLGIHVIKLLKIKGGVVNTFENVREEVESEYRRSLAENQFYELADQLAGLSYENPDTLDIAGDALGLRVHESDFFTRNEQDSALLSEPKILSASFTDDVLINGNNSEPVELQDNRVVVLRVLERIAQKKKTLDEVRERIVTKLKYEHARLATRQQGDKIIEALRNGTSMEEIANQNAFEWKHATGIKRDDTSVNRLVLRTAFRMGRPKQDKPLYGGNSLGSGDYTVIIIDEVIDAALDTIRQEEELKPIQDQLQRLFSNNVWSQYVKQLREGADIQIYSNNL